MSKVKRYYWLKLNENFFEDDTMTWLEEQDNGKDYIIFYLKLSLKSLSDDGFLVRYVGEKLIPYDVRSLSKITSTPYDTVSMAMKIFIEIGLISQYDTGEIYMNQINELIGTETDSAKRMRKKRIKDEVKQLPSHCDKDVHLCDTEREIDIEREKDIEIEEEKRISSAATLLENYLGSITQFMMEDVEYYKNHFDEFEQILELAIDITRQRSVKNWKYTKSILNDWKGHNLKTVEDIKHHENRSKVNKYKNQVTHELPPEQEEQYKNLGF